MSKLFIIGNGVDIAHGLKINYCYFYDYLHTDDNQTKKEAREALEDGWNIRTREDYSDLETKLQYPSDELKYASDGFGVNLLKAQLKEVTNAFKSWLSNAFDLKQLNRCKLFNINNDDFVINFNYTDTIHEVYEVDCNNICHIHGSIINELMACNIYDCNSFELGVGESSNDLFLEGIRKKTSSNFDDYRKRHPKILSVDEVRIIGLSFSDGDKNFLRKIIYEFNGERIKIYFYSDEDKRRIASTIEGLSRNKEKISVLDVKEYK